MRNCNGGGIDDSLLFFFLLLIVLICHCGSGSLGGAYREDECCC